MSSHTTSFANVPIADETMRGYIRQRHRSTPAIVEGYSIRQDRTTEIGADSSADCASCRDKKLLSGLRNDFRSSFLPTREEKLDSDMYMETENDRPAKPDAGTHQMPTVSELPATPSTSPSRLHSPIQRNHSATTDLVRSTEVSKARRLMDLVEEFELKTKQEDEKKRYDELIAFIEDKMATKVERSTFENPADLFSIKDEHSDGSVDTILIRSLFGCPVAFTSTTTCAPSTACASPDIPPCDLPTTPDNETITERLVAGELVTEELITQELITEEPVVKEPAAEEPVPEEPVLEETVAEKTIAEEPVAEEPVPEHPVAEHPVAEHPVAEHPVPEHPVAEHPVAEHPVAEHPVAEHPVAEHPVAEHPVTEQTIANEGSPAANQPNTPTPPPIRPTPTTINMSLRELIAIKRKEVLRKKRQMQ